MVKEPGSVRKQELKIKYVLRYITIWRKLLLNPFCLIAEDSDNVKENDYAKKSTQVSEIPSKVLVTSPICDTA